jgi:hypothetical protein
LLALHGLRKAAGVKLAESGASVQMIMSVLGHRSPRMALYYCQQANKRQLSNDAVGAGRRRPVIRGIFVPARRSNFSIPAHHYGRLWKGFAAGPVKTF